MEAGYFGDLKPKDHFVVDGREHVVSTVTANGKQRVYIETTAGSLFDELVGGYVEVKK